MPEDFTVKAQSRDGDRKEEFTAYDFNQICHNTTADDYKFQKFENAQEGGTSGEWNYVSVPEKSKIAEYEESTLFRMPDGEYQDFCYYIPNKCNHCGRFFLIRAGKYYSYCDRQLKDEPDKTCRDVGSRRCYDDKCKSDPVWQTYNRAYKAHYARYMKKKMTVSEFEEWSRFASDIRDKALAEKIPFEQYYSDIRK